MNERLIVKILPSNKDDKRGIKNLIWVLENWKNIELQIMWEQLVLLFYKGKTMIGAINWDYQDQYDLSDDVVDELRELYWVTNV